MKGETFSKLYNEVPRIPYPMDIHTNYNSPSMNVFSFVSNTTNSRSEVTWVNEWRKDLPCQRNEGESRRRMEEDMWSIFYTNQLHYIFTQIIHKLEPPFITPDLLCEGKDLTHDSQVFLQLFSDRYYAHSNLVSKQLPRKSVMFYFTYIIKTIWKSNCNIIDI